jgi:excisionase family DNA binding protein
METLLTAKDVAKILCVSKAKIYYLISRKQIPHIRLQRNVRIRPSDLEKWIESNLIKA